MNSIIVPGGAQIVALKAVQPSKADKPGTRIMLVDEVLRGSKSVQLIRVDCDSAKFYRVKFAPFQNAEGSTVPCTSFKEAKRIFDICKTILLA